MRVLEEAVSQAIRVGMKRKKREVIQPAGGGRAAGACGLYRRLRPPDGFLMPEEVENRTLSASCSEMALGPEPTTGAETPCETAEAKGAKRRETT